MCRRELTPALIDSPIDVFVHFDGKRATDIATSRYAVRHMVTHEVSLWRLRSRDLPMILKC